MSFIKERRKNLDITQKQLAQKLGVTQSTISMWETNSNFPKSSMLSKLAATLNCTVDDLLSDD